MQFDIVIPLGPNDINFINKSLEYNKKNIINYRNIYIITNTKLVKDKSIFDGCIIIDENDFPFNLNIIKKYLGDNDRCGWYLQQLLKLYAGFVIPTILDNYLVIDSDTIFLKPTSFFENDIPLYNFGTEYHLPYFIHMINLHPSFSKVNNMSGICHHSMFQKYILKELFDTIEKFHKNKKFYEIFLDSIEKKEILGSGASEYEIYFNFLLKNFPNKYKIRELSWQNVSNINFNLNNTNLDYISCHWYMRNF
jgi:hypothetical protein